MKRTAFALAVLVIAALACSIPGAATPEPTFDIHAVETIAAATLTARAPTDSPPITSLPTLTETPTLTPVPSITPYPTAGSSGRPIRIEFAQNAISASVGGSVYFPKRKQYILYAFEGQRMTVEITSDGNANFAVFGAWDNQILKRLEDENRTWTGTLPETQDYLIQVAVPTKSANFILTVTIVW